ncbi:MAG TPA: aminotransferase class I/II-fold pyridoxal phosphate-dependent enzyme, partial [Actinomycetota bacterium]|nr:aminotransferase class I/II-fold pyridoxal phosphate-dependent enzyme [Actinomycetota bacterium]
PPVPDGARHLWDGNPARALLPAFEPFLARMTGLSRLYDDEMSYPGLLDTVRAGLIADGIPADNITIAAGAFDAIERVLDAQLSPGDRVGIEDPGYHRAMDILAAQGLIAEPVRGDDRGPLPASVAEAIRRGIKGIIITPRAQNPTGAAIDLKRATELRKIFAREPELLVIEDDHAGAVAGAEYVTFADPKRARWAVVRSFAKFLGPDLRVAALTGDETTIARVEGRLCAGPGWVSYILQRLANDMLTDAGVQKTLREATELYADRRAKLIDALAQRGVTATGRSGLNVWIPVQDEQRVVAAVAANGFAIRAGEPFRLEAPPAVRVTISTLLPDEIEPLAAAIANAVRARTAVYSA